MIEPPFVDRKSLVTMRNTEGGGWWVTNLVGKLCLRHLVSHHDSNAFSKCLSLDCPDLGLR